MKLALGVILGGAMIIGCGSGASSTSGGRAATPTSATTLTGATLTTSAFAAGDPNPRYLSIEAETPDAPCTWGGAPAAPAEPGSIEADLAANPYTTGRDLYDPR
jgi:hypothetical protein